MFPTETKVAFSGDASSAGIPLPSVTPCSFRTDRLADQIHLYPVKDGRTFKVRMDNAMMLTTANLNVLAKLKHKSHKSDRSLLVA